MVLTAKLLLSLACCGVLAIMSVKESRPNVPVNVLTQPLLQQHAALSVAKVPAFAAASGIYPDDPQADNQWSFDTTEKYPGASGLFAAREFLAVAEEVVVAIVDSGVMQNHEDLSFLPGYDFIHDTRVGNDGDGRDLDPEDPGDWVSNADLNQQLVNPACLATASKWHGTAISGIVGASSHNGSGIAGGAQSVKLLPVRVTGKCGGYVADLIDGIRWAAGLSVEGVADNPTPARIINLSVGFPGKCSSAMQNAINDAVEAGAAVVTASTNSGADLDTDPYSPATCNNLFTVAANDRAGSITSYSALGKAVFITAPGGTVADGIITTQNDGNALPLPRSSYGYQFGTSIAAAHLTAAIANLLSYDSTLSNAQIEALIAASAADNNKDARCTNDRCGLGRLDAYSAQQLLADGFLLDSPLDIAPVQIASATVVPQIAQATPEFSSLETGTQTEEAPGVASTHPLSLLLLTLLSLLKIKRRTNTN